jgi:hypothetical protein
MCLQTWNDFARLLLDDSMGMRHSAIEVLGVATAHMAAVLVLWAA